MTLPTTTLWDVVVIGGGPAGMIAAGKAAELGKSVLLLEKNSILGKKLIITGGGRCNLTNNKPDVRTLLEQYKKNDKFLFSAFAQFGVEETLAFFHKRGLATKEENEGRMFPITDSAQSVCDVLIRYIKEHNVQVKTNTAVEQLQVDKDTQNIIITLPTSTITARSCVVATGGTSRPETGSTGDGFKWLKSLGHTITAPHASLVPIALKDPWVKKLSGVSLRDIKLTSFLDGKKQKAHKGRVLFTHVGISGPTVLNMSKEIGELLQYGQVHIALDLIPTRDHGNLKQVLNSLLQMEHKKKLKNILDKFIPAALVPTLLAIAKVDGETLCHAVRSEDRTVLVSLAKGLPLQVEKLLGTDKAIVSSGGVELKEVDFKTMQSRLVPNLYIVGDALNIDRPSGGYSLQLCWTTGYVAGSHAPQSLERNL